VLRTRFPKIAGPRREDICYATTNRQNAVSQLAAEVDAVLVIGSRNSSNSQRLVETATVLGRRAYLIDDASLLQPQWVDGANAVLVTAGASAPEHLVDALLDRLRREFGGVVEVRNVAEENVAFEPPKSLKSLAVVR